MTRKIYLGFLWHMHQPYYRDPVQDTYILPWVRLHAVNAYYIFPRIAEKFEKIRMTFNLVPSLLEQLEDYANGTAKDIYERYSRMHPEDLDRSARLFILRNFFMANWDTLIRPNTRYNDLLLKRGYTIDENQLDAALKNFSNQDFMDLQSWFNLAWIGPMLRDEDQGITELVKKGRFFSQKEKETILDYQREAITRVVPKYKELADSGQIEVTFSPYYHPILPLLHDTDIAIEAHPGVKLPPRFSHGEDAKTQIAKGMEKSEQAIGRKPSGMWPSEGSVSMAVANDAVGAGLKWIATDEHNLLKSLPGNPVREEVIYQPYTVPTESGNLAVFFRDTKLSDLIGFTYSRNEVKAAVEDFVGRLKKIAEDVPDVQDPVIVSVILDGENPWEYYPNSGREFLEAFLGRLQSEDWIEATTFSGYLEQHPPVKTLAKLAPGSWINGNFDIWIGRKEANLAWDFLGKSRKLLMDALKAGNVDQKVHDEVMKSLYRAEGSDWFWWFDDDFSSETEMEFDLLFRKHLISAFNLLNVPAPDFRPWAAVRAEWDPENIAKL